MDTADKFKLEEFFAALADRTRLRLLNLMRDGEVCVCFFAETLGTNNPKISRHLAYLKRVNLVTARRDGKWMHYSLNRPTEPSAVKMFDSLLETLQADQEMRADIANLSNVCCTPKFVSIASRSATAVER
ncbi:MAG TPA: metalloregulator ArsR/SmtB family transcription factor [Pyrinomonadaceae bacterium]|nr:metalloregulator ArsR/SmtB family transcription factor [Acidobacteriota bacterium]HQZ96527.1 metalloregulator ArsR/SmtB family transcription factor [Pyrinomonadaceae bacterium]